MEESPNKPGDSDFKQQRLKGWRLAPNSLILGLIYVAIGIIFLILGLVILEETSKVVEITKRYDNVDECQANWRTPRTCIINFSIDEYMEKPIYFYYEIHNMYQNHRKYNKSRDIAQLMGNERTKSEIEGYCEPITTMNDLGFYTNLDLEGGDEANPCGLVARSYFNDTFSMLHSDNVEIELDQEDIAWPIDIDEKFTRVEDWEEKQWIDVENEHFMVWMNTAGLPTFRKLWAIIDEDLDEGDYRLVIINNYDVSTFNGEKHVVVSTLTAFGGKIEFMGVLYIIVGGIAFLGSALMFTTHYIRIRKQQRERI